MQRCDSWTVQNEMREVLGRVSAGAVRRILDSADLREIRIQKKAVSIAAKTERGHSKNDEGAQVPW